jgi:hypothetical protein
MAPFAVVAPLVGPALDRAAGGRRWMVVGASAGRSLVCLFMVREVDSLLLFPLAFLLLVLAKSHQVAKSALVPTTVRSHEGLVEANSKLSLLSGVMGFLAAMPGGLLLQVGGSEWVLGLAAVVFAAAAAVAWQLPRVQVAPEPESDAGRAELRSGGVLLAATAMGLLRGVVGFTTFLLAFALRTDGSPTWHFGVVLAASGAGGLAGAALAPVLRRTIVEERILTGLLVVVAAIAAVSAWLGGVVGATVLALVVALGAAGAKQAFDSIVQRDAPDANRGRSFARFETRFQLIWVAGAIVGIIPMPMWVGFLLVAAIAAFAAVSYTVSSRATRARAERRHRRQSGPPEADVDLPRASLPPTIVSPSGEPPPGPPPPPPPPPLVPPSIATPGERPVDPTRVDDP